MSCASRLDGRLSGPLARTRIEVGPCVRHSGADTATVGPIYLMLVSACEPTVWHAFFAFCDAQLRKIVLTEVKDGRNLVMDIDSRTKSHPSL